VTVEAAVGPTRKNWPHSVSCVSGNKCDPRMLFRILMANNRIPVLIMILALVAGGTLCCAIITYAGNETADSLCSQANALEAVSRHSDAIAVWERVLADYGNRRVDCAAAMLGIGRAYAALGETENAERQFSALVNEYSSDSSNESSQALLALGLISERKQEYNQAIARYSELLTRYPATVSAIQARLRLAACYTAVGDRQKAKKELSSLLKDYPFQSEACAEATIRTALMTLARSHTDNAQVAEFQKKKSMSQFRQILTKYGELDLWCAEALLWLGSTQQQAGQTDDALASYGKVIAEYKTSRPQCLKAILGRGSIFEHSGKVAEALAEYAAILSHYPDFRQQADGAKERIMSLLSTAKVPEAIGISARQAVTSYNGVRGNAVLDAAYQELADKSGIDPAYARLLKERVDSMMETGQALEYLGQRQEAIEQYQKVRLTYPELQEESFQAADCCARILLSQKGYGAAESELAGLARRYVSDGRWCARALTANALLQYNTRHFSDCAATLRQLLRKYPDQRSFDCVTDPKMMLARALIEAGRQKEVLPILKSMVSEGHWTRSGKASIDEYMGLSLVGNPVEAERWFTRVITDFPDTPAGDASYCHRAILRCKRKAFESAMMDILMIHAKHLQHYALGHYFEAQGKKSAAAGEYEQVLPTISGSNASYTEAYAACQRLSYLYADMGDAGKASAAVARRQDIFDDHIGPVP
jgi:tetratricopeptide (TPR) repeat protein